jgi:hypothetical protein
MSMNTQRIRREIERIRLEATDAEKATINDGQLEEWIKLRSGSNADTLLCEFIRKYPHNSKAIVDYILRSRDKIRLTQITPTDGADTTQ